jgi:hypothetical protein
MLSLAFEYSDPTADTGSPVGLPIPYWLAKERALN